MSAFSFCSTTGRETKDSRFRSAMEMSRFNFQINHGPKNYSWRVSFGQCVEVRSGDAPERTITLHIQDLELDA